MQYNFDELINRRHTNSLKWDISEGVLPMWVADMDFSTAPEVMESLKEKLNTGILGYTIVPENWYTAYYQWWKREHGYQLEVKGLMFCTGVVPAISSIVRKLTSVGDQVLIQTPVYNIFFNSIINNSRGVIENPLTYNEGAYSIDFEDLELKLADPLTTMMILCNPHNPVGKIWNQSELRRVGELCHQYEVIVLSDEIHCDLVFGDTSYIPFASVSKICEQNSITCWAPSKAFNMAGLQTAAIYVPNEQLRQKVNRGINTDEVAEPNALAIEAAVAAWTKGGPWLNEMKAYLWKNRQIAEIYIREQLPMVNPITAMATYLLWIDCSEITDDTRELCDYLLKETGLYISYGGGYGENGSKFVRINLACPLVRLEEGLTRFVVGVRKFMSLEA